MKPLNYLMKRKENNNRQIGISILVLFLFSGWFLHYHFSLQGDLCIIEATREDGIYVMITGDIANPGIYQFILEPSFKELFDRAGGLKGETIDSDWSMFPASGSGTWVQVSMENCEIKVVLGAMPATYKVSLGIPISLNNAGEEALDAIPGIGPVMAEKIINYRSLSGPFQTVDELKNVSGMGELRFLNIKPYIGI